MVRHGQPGRVKSQANSLAVAAASCDAGEPGGPGRVRDLRSSAASR